MPQITVRLPPDLYDRIQLLTIVAKHKYAIQTELTKRLPGGRSAVIRYLLTLGLAAHNKRTRQNASP